MRSTTTVTLTPSQLAALLVDAGYARTGAKVTIHAPYRSNDPREAGDEGSISISWQSELPLKEQVGR